MQNMPGLTIPNIGSHWWINLTKSTWNGSLESQSGMNSGSICFHLKKKRSFAAVVRR